MDRANPFDDLTDFAVPQRKPKPVDAAGIARIAEDNGFPSRQPPAKPAVGTVRERRRYTTGRNQQLNLKAKPETIARFYALADRHTLADGRTMPLGELLELALAALEREQGLKS